MKRMHIVLVLMFIFVLTITGCNRESKTEYQRIDGHYGYTDVVFEIPSIKDMFLSIRSILLIDNNYYISVLYYNDEQTIVETSIFCINMSGELVNQIQLEGNVAPDTVVNNKLAFLSDDNNVVLMNTTDGTISSVISGVFPDSVRIETSADGFVALGNSKIVKYDVNGNIVGSVDNQVLEFVTDSYPYFEENNNSYIISATGSSVEYYKISFDNSSLELVANDETIGSRIDTCYGQYIINEFGEYKISFDNNQIETLALWDEVNIRPERFSLFTPSQYYILDDYHFAKTYEYSDGSAEVLLFEYNGEIDYSNAEIITIGGYGVSSDLSVRWAMYLFNSSNTEYRVKTVDYSTLFPYGNATEAQNAKLQLLQYFSEGNTPDIYYGDSFDYRYWGESEIVQDLLPYIENDGDFNLESITPSVRNLLIQNNHCFQLFSSYYLYGYWGLSEDFSDNNISIFELENMNVTKPFWGMTCSTDIANYIIRYPLMNDYHNIYSSNELRTAIDFSIENGISTSSQLEVEFNDFSSVANNEYLLSNAIIGDIYSFERRTNGASIYKYIGFPSIDCSYHVIRPDGLIAMSSTTSNPAACWDFMKLIFSDEVQLSVALNQGIPVNQAVLNNILLFSQNPNGEDFDDSYSSLIADRKIISPDLIECYVEAIDSIDTILCYDWGIYTIVCEEVDSYDNMKKPIDDIAESLYARLSLYIDEHYS